MLEAPTPPLVVENDNDLVVGPDAVALDEDGRESVNINNQGGDFGISKDGLPLTGSGDRDLRDRTKGRESTSTTSTNAAAQQGGNKNSGATGAREPLLI